MSSFPVLPKNPLEPGLINVYVPSVHGARRGFVGSIIPSMGCSQGYPHYKS